MSQIELPLYVRDEDQLGQILDELLALTRGKNNEMEWIEFKHNNDDPQEMGEYISALSNSAKLCEQT